ncbi:MAG: LacI family DNA-binding transcriptional regulator [Spirochaetales bacterium]|nr:LacI family DNA-binding transcriptional regulator [Spirochaetales bacterium]
MSKRVSLQDIADSLKISRGTVDRAIHNRGRINIETKERVLSEARRLGYIDRKIESFLPLQQKKRIVALIPGDVPFFRKIEEGLQKGIDDASPEFTLQIKHISLEDPEDEKVCLEGLLKIREELSGVVVIPADRTSLNGPIAKLEQGGTRVVTVNTDAPGSGRSAFIGQDLYASGRVAGELLMNMTAGPVLLMSGYERIWAHEERVKGFLDIYRESGRESEILGPFFMHEDRAQTFEILSRNRGTFKGIYAVSGQATEGAGSFLAENKFSCPLIGNDCTESNRALLRAGAVTSLIFQSPELQGYLAVKWLLKSLADNMIPPEEGVQVPIDIYFRENIDFFRNHTELF